MAELGKVKTEVTDEITVGGANGLHRQANSTRFYNNQINGATRCYATNTMPDFKMLI